MHTYRCRPEASPAAARKWRARSHGAACGCHCAHCGWLVGIGPDEAAIAPRGAPRRQACACMCVGSPAQRGAGGVHMHVHMLRPSDAGGWCVLVCICMYIQLVSSAAQLLHVHTCGGVGAGDVDNDTSDWLIDQHRAQAFRFYLDCFFGFQDRAVLPGMGR